MRQAVIPPRLSPGTGDPLVTQYAYDSCCGSMTNIDYSDLSRRSGEAAKADSTPDVSFTFNRLGQQVSVTDGQGTRSFTYNDQLQLASETNVMGVITRQYDGLGRSSGFSSGTDYAVAYGYDNAGRFLTLTSMLSALSSNTFTYSYLANSDLLSGWSNGTVTVVKSYEPNRNLLTSVDNQANGVTVSRFDYAYNPKSEITNAILAANNFGYAYDPIGNRLSATKNQEPENYSANVMYHQLILD